MNDIESFTLLGSRFVFRTSFVGVLSCDPSLYVHIIEYMKPLLIELDDEVVARLEQVAPGRTRRRSEFIRMAVRRALWELEEQATAEAYERQPDSAADGYVDPGVWEPRRRATRRRARRR